MWRRKSVPTWLGEELVLEALAIQLEDMDTMGETVEERAGDAFRSKDLGPFIEGQVGGGQC